MGSRPKTRTIKVDFLVVNCPSTYIVILGRPTMNKIGAIVSTTCLTMKFFADNGEIANVRVDQAETRRCYNASLEVVTKEPKAEISRPPSSSNVMLIDLDIRGRQEAKRPELGGELEELQIGPENFSNSSNKQEPLKFP